jgi:hypothetical protein
MINTRGKWFDTGLFLSLVSTFSFLIAISCLDVDAQPESINVQNTIVTAPLTVIVPITADVQNAQICVSAASSGDQSCTQVILSPEQNSYESINVDLSNPTTVPAIITEAPGVSKTIAPGSQKPDVASTNAPQPPVINIQNTVVTQPLTVVIPIETDAQNAQICVTVLSSGSQSCQQVVLDPEQGSYTPVNVDLSQPTPIITPQETTTTNQPPQSINVEHTVVTAPITVIVPITGDVQNAQICVSAGSSGDQSCTQLIVNPEQTSYTSVSTDLTTETPTVSSSVQQEPAAAIETANTPTTTESEPVPQTSTSTPPPQTEPAPSTTNEETSQSQSPQEGESEGQPPETSEQSPEDDTSNSNEEGQESTSNEAP